MAMASLTILSSNDCSNGCFVKVLAGKLTTVPANLSYDKALWTLFCSFLAVSMQMGFAMLQVGSVRKNHRTTVLAKNVLDSAVSALAFWIYSESSGSELVRGGTEQLQNHLLLFYWSLCGVAVTICSGSMAERAHLNTYVGLAVMMSVVIYPHIASGAWTATGLLSSEFHGKFHQDYTYYDAGGAGVVHLTGGCCAFLGSIFLGRRIMEHHDLCSPDPPSSMSSDEENQVHGQETASERTSTPAPWPRRFDNAERDKREFEAFSYLQVMGMFTLWAGWYGLNVGNNHDHGSDIAMNTTLAAAGGGLGTLFGCMIFTRKIDVMWICNGVISGLVLISAACALTTGAASVLIGVFAGFVIYPVCSRVMKRLHLDDAVDATSVHFGGGLFGVLVVALCRPDCKSFAGSAAASQVPIHFCSENYDMGKQFIAQAWGALTIIWWTVLFSGVVFATFAICECTIALEAKYLADVHGILLEMALSEPGSTVDPRLAVAVRRSEIALGILKHHGWASEQFKNPKLCEPIYLLQICRQVKSNQKTKSTALEVAEWRSFRLITKIMWRISVHKFLSWRLRITPAAELAGTSTDLDSGTMIKKMVKKLHRTLRSMDREAKTSQHDTLKKEVRELHALVHGQSALLRSLNGQKSGKGSGYGCGCSTGSRGTPPIKEQFDLPVHTHSSSRLVVDSQSDSTSDEDGMGLMPRHLVKQPRAGVELDSNSTTSDHGMGIMTPHSANDGTSTPPPSMLGIMHPDAQAGHVNLLAERLVRSHSATRPVADSDSNSTLSQHGMGALTPHSVNSETPPSSTFVRMRPDPQMARLSLVAQRLNQVLEQQQQLFAAASNDSVPSAACLETVEEP